MAAGVVVNGKFQPITFGESVRITTEKAKRVPGVRSVDYVGGGGRTSYGNKSYNVSPGDTQAELNAKAEIAKQQALDEQNAQQRKNEELVRQRQQNYQNQILNEAAKVQSGEIKSYRDRYVTINRDQNGQAMISYAANGNQSVSVTPDQLRQQNPQEKVTIESIPAQQPRGILDWAQVQHDSLESTYQNQQQQGLPPVFIDYGKGKTLNVGGYINPVFQYADTKLLQFSNLISNKIKPLFPKSYGIRNYFYSERPFPEITKNVFFAPAFAGGLVTKAADIPIISNKVITFTPTRKTVIPTFAEEKTLAIVGGREFVLSNYKITGEISPPFLKTTTTTFRQTALAKAMGFQPLKEELIPARVFKISTLKPAVNNLPFEVSEYIQGRKSLNIRTISGYSNTINPKTATLSSINNYLFKASAEDVTKGIPVSKDITPQFFSRNAQFELGEVNSLKQLNYNARTKTLNLFSNKIYGDLKLADRVFLKSGQGRLTQTYRVLSRVKPFAETPDLEISSVNTYFKDITYPNARASGRVPRMKGIVSIRKEPIVIGGSSEVTTIYGSGGKSTAKAIQELKLSQPLPKILPKPRVYSPVTKAVGTTKTSNLGILPSVSAYYGQGSYERTSGGLMPSVKSIDIFSSRSLNVFKPSIKTQNRLIELPLSKTISSSKALNINKVTPIIKTEQRPTQKQTSRLLSLPKLTSKNTSKTNQNPFFYSPRATRSPTPKGIFNLPYRYQTPKGSSVFTIFSKQKGIFRPIGRSASYGQAVRLGKLYTDRTINATFKVTGTGQRNYILPEGYYINRGGAFVERRARRLNTRSEVKTINLFKNLSGKSGKKRKKGKYDLF